MDPQVQAVHQVQMGAVLEDQVRLQQVVIVLDLEEEDVVIHLQNRLLQQVQRVMAVIHQLVAVVVGAVE